MVTINLRDYYPFYQHDEFVEVSDTLAIQFLQWERDENNLHRKKRRYHATYSLDYVEGFEQNILPLSDFLHEQYEKKLTQDQLRAVLLRLPNIQAKRIYAHYILGLSKAEIARIEGVSDVAVWKSIAKGLKRLEIFLRDYL